MLCRIYLTAMRPRWLSWMLLSGLCCSASAQVPFHRAYTTADGLASNQVYCALEDKEGLMWFGTDAGVSRFDGTEFRNYGPADGLSDTEVIGLYEDIVGRIWFLTLNGRLSYWLNGVVHNPRSDTTLVPVRAASGWTNACEDSTGRLWFSGIRGELFNYDARTGRSMRFDKDGGVCHVFPDSRGRIVSLLAGTLCVFDGSRFVELEQGIRDWFPNPINNPSMPGADGLTISASGFLSVSGDGIRPIRMPGVVQEGTHRAAERDRFGNIWLYRRTPGVEFFPYAQNGHSPAELQFPDVRIYTVRVARTADRWYCTATQGVLLVEASAIDRTEWHRGDSKLGSAHLALAAALGGCWVGTDLGAILRYTHGMLLPAFEPGKGRLPGRILHAISTSSGATWFAADWGLFRWSPQQPDTLELIPSWVSTPHGLEKMATPSKTVLEDHAGAIIAPGIGLHRVVQHRDGPRREPWLDERVPRARIYCIAQDARDRYWFETGSVVYRVDGDSVANFPWPESYAGSRITEIAPWRGDTMLFGTAGNGLLRWVDGRVLGPLLQANGMDALLIRRIRSYGDTVVCSTARGVHVLLRQGANAMLAWQWTEKEGLPSNDVHDAILHEGRVLMATALGLCVAPLRPLSPGTRPLRMRVAHIHVNDSALSRTDGPLVLRVGDRLLAEVHAVAYGQTEALEYTYALDGGEWFPCDRGRVVLSGVREGEHELTVRARLGGQTWAEPWSLHFEARPVWWASRLARMAVLFGLFALVLFGLYYLSRRRFRKQLARVQAMAVVNEERRRIASDVHDDLGADLSRLLLHARQLEHQTAGGDKRVTAGLSASIDKIDEIIWSLDPNRDTLRSTVHFIEQLARELAETHGVRFRTEVDMHQVDAPLAASTRRELMLLAREALRNAIEHAAPTTLWFRCGWDQRTVQLSVEDDGLGFDPGAPTERNGLKNMHARAGRLGGELHIGPREEGGTRVVVRFGLPLNHPNG